MPEPNAPAAPAAPAAQPANTPALPSVPPNLDAAPAIPLGDVLGIPSQDLPEAPTAPAIRKGSAKDALFAKMRGEEPAPAEEPAPGEQPPNPNEPPKPPAEEPPKTPEGAKPKRKSAYRMAEHWKERAQTAEQELTALKTGKSALPDEERTGFEGRLKTLEERNGELENEIRYVDYSKSTEFKEKYQQPYEAAINRAVADLKEIPASDPDSGETRYANFNDLMALVQMPLAQAKKVSDDWFGDFSAHVMGHRQSIKEHLATQNSALKTAREAGATRQEQSTARSEEINGQLKSSWEQHNKESQNIDGVSEHFTPVEGDAEINSRLEKGFAFVDEAFSANAQDPNLKPEQRSEIIRKHVAVRNMAAAFRPMKYRMGVMTAEITALKARLAEFESTEPPAGGGSAPPAAGAASKQTSAKGRLFGKLREAAGQGA